MIRFIYALAIVCCTLFAQAQKLTVTKSRLSPSLSTLLLHSQHDSIDVVLSFKNADAFRAWSSKVNVHYAYKPVFIVNGRIGKDQLSILAADTSVAFAQPARRPKEEFATATLDITLNRINFAHSRFPSVKGDDIKVSLKEQLFDAQDIDIRGRYFNSTIEAPNQSGHASAMATMLGGAGNSALTSTGVATGVHVSSSDFETLLPDDDAIYDQFNISVQNHSYGTGIENFYGSDAAAYDATVISHPSLLHVFSSGNSGLETPAEGPYSGIPAFANITGSFKMAKNIITAGATDSFDVVVGPSSKGPAYDGRVKPEIVAYGEDGSSGAAALVSGAAALVQQEYLQLTGNLPRAELTKAVLLNSANNKNNQVNYTSGYGSLDVNRALTIIQNDHFVESEVNKNGSENITIEVPSNISRLKVMIVWTDPPAEANAPRALVNDLDASLLLNPSNPAWLPWVLDPAEDPAALTAPATRKVDTLNNVEQITVDDPAPGSYILSVNADKIITSSQKFAVTYIFDTLQNFSWTYPTAADKVEAGRPGLARWQTNITEDAQLEYSLNNGSWTAIKNVNAGTESGAWNVPDTFASARLRITIPSLGITRESETFTVSPAVSLQVGFDCGDSVLYYFNHHDGTEYQVYQLGEKYMDPIFTTTDSFFIIKKSESPALHYAVAPKVNGNAAFRSYAIDYTTQGAGCYFQGFFVSLSEPGQAQIDLELGTLFQVNAITFEKLTPSGFQEINTIVSPAENHLSYSDNQVSKGINTYRSYITLVNGKKIYSTVESVYYLTPADPVIIYPNPVNRNQPFHIITNEPGVYTATIYDINGKMVLRSLIDDTNQEMHGISLARGLYLVRISSAEGNIYSKKLLVR